MDIFERVRELNLPLGQYAVFGSGPLEAHGLRDAIDIDLLVSPALYEVLKSKGWKEEMVIDRNQSKLTDGEVEAMMFWNYPGYKPDEILLISEAEIINGLPFVRLKEVLAWKRVCGRVKDMADIKLIETYLRNKNSPEK